MEKSVKCWLKSVKEQDAEYENKIANLKFTVQHMAQVTESGEGNNPLKMSNSLLIIWHFTHDCNPCFKRERWLRTENHNGEKKRVEDKLMPKNSTEYSYYSQLSHKSLLTYFLFV